MDNLPQNYVFNFTPKLLAEERKRVERKYEDIDKDSAMRVAPMRLPRLLELIRSTSIDGLEEMARTWRKMDVMVLLYEYPYENESNETKHKINRVLCFKYSAAIGIFAWQLFQHRYQDVFLQDLLRQIYDLDQFKATHYSEDSGINTILKQAMTDKNGVATGIGKGIVTHTAPVVESLKQLKITEVSPLDECINLEILKHGLPQLEFVTREGSSFVVSKLERYPLSQYRELLKGYLEVRDYEQFDDLIMKQAIHRLQDPRDRKLDWEFLSEQAFEQVEKWLIGLELEIIFEHDEKRRGEFWKTYTQYINKVVRLTNKNDPVAAYIYFDHFVVIEFGEVGRAYFYHRKGFQKWNTLLTSTYEYRSKGIAAKESLLKEQAKVMHGEPLFIERISHSGYYETWTAKFNRHIQAYMRGQFQYKEL